MKGSIVLITAAAQLIITSSAFATDSGTVRCKGGIVSVGDTAGEVVAKCGQPTFATQREEKKVEPGTRSSERKFTVVAIDEWSFNFGPNEFQYAITVANGRVIRIQSLDRGY